jgi:8-oxo-dGTP diphosphatase
MKTKATQTTKETHLHFAVLATDIVILTLRGDELLVRLMDVNSQPFFNHVPGLPGGLIHPEETAEEAARRIIREKADVSPSQTYLEQLYTFSEVDRDPRGRVVAVAYCAYVPWEKLVGNERKNQEHTWWEPLKSAKKLAYDHDHILATAIERFRSRIRYTTLMAKLMPNEFTLTELEKAFAGMTREDVDKRNFRKKIEKLALLEETGHMTSGEKWRPAKLYRFKRKSVENIEII